MLTAKRVVSPSSPTNQPPLPCAVKLSVALSNETSRSPSGSARISASRRPICRWPTPNSSACSCSPGSSRGSRSRVPPAPAPSPAFKYRRRMTATTCGSPLEIDRHEQRARDRVAVELELPVVGAPPRADARAAEPLPEHRELRDVEVGACEHAAPVAAALPARAGAVPERDNASQSSTDRSGRLPFSVTPRSARNSASAPPNSSAARRNCERPRLAERGVEIEREAARRAQVAVHRERRPAGTPC